MNNYYQEFDNIMEYYQEAKQYVLDNAEYFANKKAEKITYSSEIQSVAICKNWHYVPNLSHASKDKTIAETGSPAQLWIYKLDITNPKKITGKMIESYEYDVSAYRKNPPILPAPQIHTKIAD